MATSTETTMKDMKRTMVIELKYVSSNHAVIHTENCKITLDLNSSPKDMQTTIVNACGIKESAAKRGFAGYAIELFYVDFVEDGNPKKAPFVLRTNDQIEMLKASRSYSVRSTPLSFLNLEQLL